MIEINLLPHELKAESNKADIGPGKFLYLVPLVFALLIFVHICLAIVSIFNAYNVSALNKRLKTLGPQRKIYDNFNKENAVFSSDAQLMHELVSQRVIWSEKLNKLSLNLPPGIWFAELAISSKNFSLRGSVVSLQNEGMPLINKFIEKLKSDAGFFKDFSNLTLSSWQRRVIGGVDIMDFTLVGSLKEK